LNLNIDIVDEDENENENENHKDLNSNNSYEDNDNDNDNGNYKDNNDPYNKLFKNIFEDKDDLYYENLNFQDQRTQNMNEAEYLEYINCRSQSLLSKGKKIFLNYLNSIFISTSSNNQKNKNKQNINININKENHYNNNNSNINLKENTHFSNYSINNINDEDLIESQKKENSYFNNYNNNSNKNEYINNNKKNLDDNNNTEINWDLINSSVPCELKDPGNLELACFILKEIMHKIVKLGIKNKNPANKLMILNYPLTVEDLEENAEKELDKLDQFLNDYSVSIYLMKEFKKKKLLKLNNKNVKIKKKKGSFFAIIKKYIFLEPKESEFFRKNRKSIENKIMEKFKYLYNKYLIQINSKKKSILNKKIENGKNNINKNRKSTRNIYYNKNKNQDESDNNNNNEDENISNNDLIVITQSQDDYNNNDKDILKEISKKYLVDILDISNYYEYYLLRDIIKENEDNNNNNINININNYVTINFSKLKKINKKYFNKKFDIWLKFDYLDKEFYKNEYRKIKGIKEESSELIF
jgi:hypothetical protein